MNILLILKLLSTPDPLTAFCIILSTLSTKQKQVIHERLLNNSKEIIDELMEAVN